MHEIVFYLQVLALLFFFGMGAIRKSWVFFLLAGIFCLNLGIALAANEPIEFSNGGFTVIENVDENIWTSVPDLNRLTIENSPMLNSWHWTFLAGGFVLLIVALVLAVSGRVGVKEVED